MKSFFRHLVFAAALLSQGEMVQAADAPVGVFLATPQELSIRLPRSDRFGRTEASPVNRHGSPIFRVRACRAASHVDFPVEHRAGHVAPPCRGAEYEEPRGKITFWAFEAYDPKANSWQVLPHMRITRHGFVAAFLGNDFHAAGGSFQSDGMPGIRSQTATHEVYSVSK